MGILGEPISYASFLPPRQAEEARQKQDDVVYNSIRLEGYNYGLAGNPAHVPNYQFSDWRNVWLSGWEAGHDKHIQSKSLK